MFVCWLDHLLKPKVGFVVSAWISQCDTRTVVQEFTCVAQKSRGTQKGFGFKLHHLCVFRLSSVLFCRGSGKFLFGFAFKDTT